MSVSILRSLCRNALLLQAELTIKVKSDVGLRVVTMPHTTTYEQLRNTLVGL